MVNSVEPDQKMNCSVSGVDHDNDADIETIPEPVPRGIFKPVAIDRPPTYMVVDLETTDLIRGDQLPHLTQIACQELNSGLKFNCYVVPKIPTAPSAERVTKICMRNQSDMIVNGVPVESLGIKQSLQSFQNVLLVAHNGRRFDFIVLTSALTNCGLFDENMSVVTALADSLTVFKSVIKDQESYKQEELARNVPIMQNMM